jgi:hypothetical protein
VARYCRAKQYCFGSGFLLWQAPGQPSDGNFGSWPGYGATPDYGRNGCEEAISLLDWATMATRKRRFGSVASELVKKAREAMLTAVQIYNNPQIEFKSELFIVTNVIAWTYLLHSYYRKNDVEYRQIDERAKGQRRKFLTTQYGAVRHWSLEQCLNSADCPLDDIVRKNLLFLIGIRHEIEHQMTTRIDGQMSAKFMASALNFNAAIKKHFGPKYSLENEQAFSIQFSSIDQNTAKILLAEADLPQHIRSFVVQFENGMSQDEYDDSRFSYRVAFVKKISNSKASADQVYEFVPAGSEAETQMNKAYLKETEKAKYKPSTVVSLMKAEGYKNFRIHHHSELWKAADAKNPKYQYGTDVEGTWFWYESWLPQVRKHCMENEALYRLKASSGQPSAEARLVG